MWIAILIFVALALMGAQQIRWHFTLGKIGCKWNWRSLVSMKLYLRWWVKNAIKLSFRTSDRQRR